MSEVPRIHEPIPQDPELLVCQTEIKTICDEILYLKPEQIRLTFWDVASGADPMQVQQRLRATSLGDLLLKHGETLSGPAAGGYYPDLGLYIGQAELEGVSVRAWGWEHDKYRINPEASEKPPYDVIEYPGEIDWSRQLDISLHYTNARQTARQTISMQTGSNEAGQLPAAFRDVSAMAYAESGYGGHNQLWRSAHSEEEVAVFIALARDLINDRD